MFVSARYEKGRGNNAIYARARNTSGQFYNFATLNWDVAESSNSMSFLAEHPDGDPLDSLYSADILFPDLLSIQELVDFSDGLVIGSGTYTPAVVTSTLTLGEIEASTVLAKESTVSAIPTDTLRTGDTRLDNLDAPISRVATYDQVDSIFSPMLDLLADIVVNTSGGGGGSGISPALTQEIHDVADALLGSWEIVNRQMIFSRRDGTELMRFNLVDKLGNPSEHNVFKREKV